MTARKPTQRPHRRAITRMLRATGLVHVPEEAPLIELLRDLADQMDQNSGTRVAAAYLSALKDLRRVLNSSYAAPHGSAEVSLPADPTEEDLSAGPTPVANELAQFKARKGIA